jgi:hypothetical protein
MPLENFFDLIIFKADAKSLAILRALAEKFSLQLKDFGISSMNILVGSQFSICACLSLIRVACPVGPLSLSLLMRFEICDSVCISQMLLRLRILLCELCC